MSEVDRDDLLRGVGGCGLCYVRKIIIKQNIGNRILANSLQGKGLKVLKGSVTADKVMVYNCKFKGYIVFLEGFGIQLLLKITDNIEMPQKGF